MYLDTNGKRWFKGNLHTHTTISDGRYTPEEVIKLYRQKEYDFLSLTDHWRPSKTEQVDDILLLSGCEYNIGETAQQGIYHIVAVGFDEIPALEQESFLTAQQIIDAIHEASGLAILAHPAWSLNTPDAIASLRHLDGTEIYNSVSGSPWNCRPYSGHILDVTAVKGTLLPLMAADDTHFYEGDECISYLMVKAEECTPTAIMTAIRQKDFYATQGPHLTVSSEDNRVMVTCSPATEVVFYTDSVYAPDRVTRGEGITEAYYRIQKTDTFVRVEVTDDCGRTAWSSFIPLRDKE